MKIAAFAALGEIATLRAEGVKDPLVLACNGVNDGESTLNLFFMFSFWFSLEGSWIYGQAGPGYDSDPKRKFEHSLFSYRQWP